MGEGVKAFPLLVYNFKRKEEKTQMEKLGNVTKALLIIDIVLTVVLVLVLIIGGLYG